MAVTNDVDMDGASANTDDSFDVDRSVSRALTRARREVCQFDPITSVKATSAPSNPLYEQQASVSAWGEFLLRAAGSMAPAMPAHDENY